MNDWGNVAVSCRIGSMAHPLFFDSWSRLLFEGMREDDRLMSPAIRMPAHRAANAIVRAFLTEDWLADCQTLLFVDDDHQFPADTLERLRRAEGGRPFDVLGALYSARGAGRWPIVLRLSDKATPEVPKYGVAWGWEPGEVVEVDALGLGFTLIRRSLLERIPFPWFSYRDDEDGTEYTEDVVFSWRVKDAGGRAGVHTGVTIGHIDNVVLRPATSREQAMKPNIEAHMTSGGGNGKSQRTMAGSGQSVEVRPGGG